MNIGICPDECRLFYQVRLPFFYPPYLSAACLELVPHVLHKMEGGTNILRIGMEVPQLKYATQNLETALQHQPSQNVLPFAVTNQLSPVFWANLLNSGSSKACCLFDHIWSRLPYQDEPNLHQISCLPGCITTEAAFGAGNHKHGTPPVRPEIRKNTALNGWFCKKWNL